MSIFVQADATIQVGCATSALFLNIPIIFVFTLHAPAMGHLLKWENKRLNSKSQLSRDITTRTL